MLRTGIRLQDVFDERVEASLSRGMPATLLIHAELWRSRTAWFDRLVSNADVSIKVRYEALRSRYRIERPGLPTLDFDSIDSVRTMLSRVIPMPAMPSAFTSASTSGVTWRCTHTKSFSLARRP